MPDETPPLVALEDVRKTYGRPGGGPQRQVLDGVNLHLEAGGSLAVIGPSGCGKSTLLNLIGGLDRPTAGRVLLDGRDLAGLGERQLAAVRARQVGFVFQMHHLLPQCTVWENVLVPTLAGGVDAGPAPDRAHQLLSRVGLADHLRHTPGELSGGQQQRVAVVRALINRPKLLLADEPTGSLDRPAAEALMDLLAELNAEEGVAVITVTHAPFVAERMARQAELHDGRLDRPAPVDRQEAL